MVSGANICLQSSDWLSVEDEGVRTNLRARGCPTLPLADPVTRAGPATFLVHTTMRQCSKKIKIRIEGT